MQKLPVVNPEVGYSLEHSLEHALDRPYVKQALKNIRKENPAVAEWIKKFSKLTDDRIGSAFCAIIVYKMLQSQLEADCLKEEINLAD